MGVETYPRFTVTELPWLKGIVVIGSCRAAFQQPLIRLGRAWPTVISPAVQINLRDHSVLVVCRRVHVFLVHGRFSKKVAGEKVLEDYLPLNSGNKKAPQVRRS